VGWGDGQPPVGAAVKPPAALMHRPMMGPAHQGQIGQIRRAAMQPTQQMMGLTPGQRPPTAREHTAPVAHGQALRWAGWTTRPAHPTSNGWLGAPPRTGGSSAIAARSRSWSPLAPPGSPLTGPPGP
jgi:hypothetical protein